MQIQIFQDKESLHRAVAQMFIEAVKVKPNIILGLATGSSPLETYENLIKDHKENGTDYSEVVTFNLDEYIGLEGSHSQSYRYFMNTSLFNGLNIPLGQTNVPSGTGDVNETCEAYENEITNAGGIDLQLLGIGTNGHIGFNEPGTPFDTRTHVTALTQETIDGNARFFESADSVPKKAVTMGIQSIMGAKKIALIAYGSKKAAAIRDMVNGPITESMPASILQNHPDATLFLDEEAAALLKPQ
ncbi:glucosamine-6-phosphate deaminase [Cyclobacterium sp. 1_MG-2023]|uniref:glucosamine-6-phosphate deaminase n=1 Tax=Cyclobacterium sp. 1_MG-2023 TaxID=3062681 RepID=UPI0026E30FD2|nr:glucosamine-6-phosphate deaminase [Cyclobacterium sp. 1_MG-2023]MDO6439851.1 glucosamine-6-phosphate deaminase [Cyclobacterium sp. 1_MG-2023]